MSNGQISQVSQNIQYINGIPYLATHYVHQPIQSVGTQQLQTQQLQTQQLQTQQLPTQNVNSVSGSNQRPMMQPIVPPTYQTISLSNNPIVGFPVSYVVRR